MWIVFLIFSLAGGNAPQASLETLDGKTLVGTLVAASSDGVTLDTDQGRKTLPLDELIELLTNDKAAGPGFAGVHALQKDEVHIELADGSVVLGSRFTVNDETARFDLLLPEPLHTAMEIPISRIVAVRLQAETEETAAEWKRIQERRSGSNAGGDLLVIKKDNSLDYHEGVLGDISDKVVAFNLDGDTLPVPRGKVFGLLYHRLLSGDSPSEICRLMGSDGSRWAVRRMELRDGVFSFETPDGLVVSLPLAAVHSVDFSGGKVVYLDDLTPIAADWTPYLGGEKSSLARRSLFGPRTGRNTAGEPIRLGGKEFSRGISLHSRAELAYRLPQGFKRFRATAGIDDRARPHGHVRLTLRGDGRVLLDTALSGTDPPLAVDVDISGSRTLTILVDYGDDLDVADHLGLGDARVVK